MLEDEVEEKYYLSDKLLTCFMSDGTGKYPRGERFKQNIFRKNTNVAVAITTNPGNRATDNFIIPFGSYYTWKDKKGNINTQCNRAANPNKSALTVACAEPGKVLENNLRIRKLTPKECWRLMGFTDEDFDKASKVNSNAQLYKQAGNSIVVQVLEAIFKELL